MALLDDIYNTIARPILDQIYNNILPALDWIWDQLTYLLNKIWDWILQGVNKLWSWLSPILDAVWSRVQGIWENVRNLGTAVYSWISNAIISIVQGVWLTLEGIYARISSSFSSLFSSLSSLFNAVFSSLSDFFHTLYSQMSGILGGITSWIQANVVTRLESLWASITAALANVSMTVSNWLTALNNKIEEMKQSQYYQLLSVATMTAATNQTGQMIYNELAGPEGGLGDKLLGGFREVLGWIFDKMRDIGGRIAGWVTDTVIPGLKGAGAALLDWLKGILGGVWEKVIGILMPHSEFDIPDPIARSKEIMMVGGAIFGGLGISSVLGELVHPLKELGLGHLSGMVYDIAGWQWVTGAIMGTIGYVSLRTPLRYQLNKLIRPEIPSVGTLMAMGAKRDLLFEEFAQYMAMQGYSDYLIYRLYWHQWRDPRLFEIVRMCEVLVEFPTPAPEDMWESLERLGIDPNDPNWWLRYKFMKAGYEPVDIDILVSATRRKMEQAELSEMKSLAKWMYAEGFMTEDELTEVYVQFGHQPNMIPPIIDVLKLKRKRQADQELIKSYEYAYSYAQIGYDELKEELLKMSLDPAWIEARLTFLKMKRESKGGAAEKNRRIPLGHYERAYRDKIIGSSELTEYMKIMGYPDQDIMVTLQLYAPAKEEA